jgi:hypothetical protein
LPELLARELAGLWPDDADREIAAPIRISVPMRMSELLAAADQPSPAETVSARIAQAVREALKQEEIAPLSIFQSESRPDGAHQEDKIEIAQESSSRSAVLRLLTEWRTSGALEMRLAAFSLTALEAWHRRLIRAEGKSVDREDVSRKTVDELVSGIIRRSGGVARDRANVLRRRIIVVVEAMAQLKLHQCGQSLLAVVDRMLPLGDKAVPESLGPNIARKMEPSETHHCSSPQSETDDGHLPLVLPQSMQAGSSHRLARREMEPSETQPGPSPQSGTEEEHLPLALPRSMQDGSSHRFTGREVARRPMAREMGLHIASALPFLLLGPLSRLGYLKTLAATMEAAECLGDSQFFAAALAFKVLDPPARGWRREPAMIRIAAAFAALDQPADEPTLVDFARRISPHLSPLDAVISDALIAGHNAHQPLLLHRTGSDAESGFLLVDVEGLFPITWAASPIELRQTLIRLDSSVVLIPQASAEMELLRWFDAEGFRFITDAPPARGERWRALRRQPRGRWWTNDVTGPETALAQMARSMKSAAEETEVLWQSLDRDRPSVTRSDDAALDRHITLAASTALGTIALELWRKREPTAPRLALERFRDLDGRIYYSRDVVRLRLPLGRRFHDLRDHGLLNDVEDAPWLDGRKLVFTSG